jgi:pimeloyl-ACP methyl ester carboxylesterase
MPYTLSHGEKIHYQIEDDGPSLVLQHGGFGSIEDWYEYGYVTALKSRFQLVLIDARAHGKSEKPHDVKKYSPELHASDVVAVLDKIKVSRCHYLGYSLGGRIGYWVATFYPDRLRSLMVFGMHPYPFEKSEIMQSAETIDVWAPMVPNISEKHKLRLLENDKEALLASYSTPWPDESHILRSLTIPCLIVCGDCEGDFEDTKRSASESSGATFVQLDGFDHVDTLVRSNVTIPHIIGFLSSVDDD